MIFEGMDQNPGARLLLVLACLVVVVAGLKVAAPILVPFILALFDNPQYLATYCGGSNCAADLDGSGVVNFFDIDPFVACLFGQCP